MCSTAPISKLINLKEFYNEFKQEINVENFKLSDSTNDAGDDINFLYKDELNTDQVILDCSLDKLYTDSDRLSWDEIKIMKPRQLNKLDQFKSYEAFENAFAKCNFSSNEFMNKWHRNNPITKDLSYNNRLINCDMLNTRSRDLVLDDIIVTVIVYKPLHNPNDDKLKRNQLYKLSPLHQFDLLGETKLEILEQKIKCKNSESLMGDFSEVLDDWKKYKVSSSEMFKGSFFYIENVFYDADEGENLSYNIVNWVFKDRERLREYGHLQRRSMSNVKIIDLSICLGKPYLYQHLGNCEHVIIFSDVKMVNKHNCQSSDKYPILTGSCRFSLIKCCFCDTVNADWLVINCALTPLERTPLCDFCIKSFLYDESGSKISEAGDFKVFRLPSFLNNYE